MDNLKDFIPKLNYDDFYKFTTSFCLFGWFLGLTGITVMTLYVTPEYKWYNYAAIIGYIFIEVVSVIGFVWASFKWKKKQENIDQLLELEIIQKAAECAKKITEIGKEIELSTVETVIAMTNPNIDVSTVKRNKALELVERIKKSSTKR